MSDYGYGLWFLVLVNSAVFIVFALSFFHPRTRRDWKAMGAFSSFIMALFVEMYGFPLTIYLLSGWAGSRFDSLDLTHNGGHLWSDLLGWKGDPHLSPFHLASYVLIGGGFWAIAAAWPHLLDAAKRDTLAVTGPYARLRHPQYAGFLLIMIGLLLQWPTIPTLVMFPILVLVYRRLALQEERVVASRFGATWDDYARHTPRFIPHLGPLTATARSKPGDNPPTPRSTEASTQARGAAQPSVQTGSPAEEVHR